MQVKNLIHPDFSSYLNDRWEKLLQGEVADSYEYKIIHKDGSERWLHQRNFLVRDEKGSAIAIEGIVTDITISKIEEETLKKSEKKYRLITESVKDCIALVGEHGIIQHVINSLEIVGYDYEELIGINGLNIIHPDDLERIRNLYWEALQQILSEITFDARIRHKDGHYIPMEIRARTLIGPQGDIIGGVFSASETIKRRQKKPRKLSAQKSLSVLPDLSMREKEVLSWIMQGKSTWDISKILDIGEGTVKFHVDKAMRKLSAVNRTHAVAIAMQNELLN